MEEESIELLQGLKPGLDKETARAVLAKHKGDMQAAAVAILEGDTSSTSQWQSSAFASTAHSDSSSVQARANTPVVQECACLFFRSHF